ncbi:MAG: nitroreductase family deazaflavin-dependent oxidoreductase [Chloroflexi bacterium]|nr:MAG: nitroreductase family deazaflavin-dependent oxidoreductase [Chloroflexota bacterium]
MGLLRCRSHRTSLSDTHDSFLAGSQNDERHRRSEGPTWSGVPTHRPCPQTRGAKTGLPRRTTLGWFTDDRPGSWIVVGSNGGAAAHPAWVINLVRQKIVELAPGYGKYTEQTDRVIPVIRLVRT